MTVASTKSVETLRTYAEYVERYLPRDASRLLDAQDERTFPCDRLVGTDADDFTVTPNLTRYFAVHRP